MRFRFGISRLEKTPDMAESAERNKPTGKPGDGEAGTAADIEKTLN